MFYPLFFALYLLSATILQAEYIQTYEGPIKVEFSEYLSIVQKFLPENPVIVEAGGHYGTDTARFAKLWPKASIISFEPNPGAYTKLVMETLKYPNVQTFPIALGKYDGEAIFHVCYGSTGNNSIYEGASSLLAPADYMAIHYQGPDIHVSCRVLDHWCEENNVNHVDFMWLDLEGMELQVLESSPKILGTVKAVLVETNFQEFRKGMTLYPQLKKFMEDSGFILLCHSYVEGLQGDALFIRN
ncbi:MAG TPA: FkbM family methyltransferase [Chlamydiales bacterium]|nr:FkbM family methyltransferase [Chlamydiales bacterium]